MYIYIYADVMNRHRNSAIELEMQLDSNLLYLFKSGIPQTMDFNIKIV